MRVGGHRMREHLRLLTPLFIFLALVWSGRLIFGAVGVPLWVSKLFSVTTAASVAVFLAVILIHKRRFGGYANVVVASLLLNFWSQFLIIIAILFSVATKTVNIYTLPEFSMKGDDPSHLHHIYGHLTFGTGLGTLFGAGMGCLLLWLLRIMVPAHSQQAGDNEVAEHGQANGKKAR